MKRVPINRVERVAQVRDDHFLNDYITLGKSDGYFLNFTDDDYAALCQIHAPIGLGDMIALATKSVGITPCAGCKERQEAINRKLHL